MQMCLESYVRVYYHRLEFAQVILDSSIYCSESESVSQQSVDLSAVGNAAMKSIGILPTIQTHR